MSYDQSVSSLVSNILIPFVSKALEPIATKLGEKATSKIEDLYNTIKSKFSSDPNATKYLERFEKNPEGYKDVIEDDLKDKFDEDPSFKETILNQAKEIQKDPSVTIYLENLKGDKIVGQEVGNMKSGSSDITIKSAEAKEIIAQKVENMGS
jgi:hypothetical protein